MAKLKVLPHLDIIDGFKGKVDFYLNHQTCDPDLKGKGIPCARKWPRSPGHLRAPAVMARWSAFAYSSSEWNNLSPEIQSGYNEMASGTGLSGRDMFTRSYLTGLYRYELFDEEEMKLEILDPEISILSLYPVSGHIAWTDILLPEEVPPTATIVFVRPMVHRWDATIESDYELRLRPKGGTQSVPVIKQRGGIAEGFTHTNDTFIKLGTEKKIQYKFTHGGGTDACEILIWLLGYIAP